VLVQGYGRVSKYRHCLYEWLGVDKVELAVMAELLLRGAQSEGELRAHAARMEPIADLNALRPVLASLQQKGLVISLSPEGRGHVVSHALYQPRELEALRAQHAAAPITTAAASAEAGWGEEAAPGAPAPGARPATDEPLRIAPRELEELRAQVAAVRSELDDLAAALRQMDAELQRLKRELGA
jgi:uncharacterized protein YceH (UPF0502 family)